MFSVSPVLGFIINETLLFRRCLFEGQDLFYKTLFADILVSVKLGLTQQTAFHL
jgi:hypothetical protein